MFLSTHTHGFPLLVQQKNKSPWSRNKHVLKYTPLLFPVGLIKSLGLGISIFLSKREKNKIPSRCRCYICMCVYIYIYGHCISRAYLSTSCMKDIDLQMFSVHLVCKCLTKNTVFYSVFVRFLILCQMLFLYLMQNKTQESYKHENRKRFQMQLCQC